MKDALLALFMGIIAGMLISAGISKLAINGYREKAVSHGAAEWVVDQKTGNTSFRWKGGKGE